MAIHRHPSPDGSTETVAWLLFGSCRALHEDGSITPLSGCMQTGGSSRSAPSAVTEMPLYVAASIAPV